VNMDIVSKVEELPQPGQSVKSSNFKFVPGGKGANQAVAASRLGGRVSFLGKVGKDAFGKTITAFLKKEKLQLHSLQVSKTKPTGTVMILVDRKGTNIMSWMGDCSNLDISISQVKNLSIQQGDIVVSTLEIPQVVTKYLFKAARKAGATTILNVSPVVTTSSSLLSLADYLVVNEHELKFFTKAKKTPSTSKELAAAIKRLAVKSQIIIVTLGKEGLVYLKNGKLAKISGYKVKAVDTTAAGDSFLGAFATAISKHQALKQAANFANAAAALSVQKVGASTSLPRLKEVENFLKNYA